MKKMKVVLMLCIGAALLMCGCSKKNQEQKPAEMPSDGGTTIQTSSAVRKEIESDNLVSFRAEFFRFGDEQYPEDRKYLFKMTKTDENLFVITEGKEGIISCETDQSFADALQTIIREYDLIELNGTWEETSGLPVEFSPCSVDARYDSDEKLSFHMDGDPEEEWTGKVLDLFEKEFAKN